ncbi:MAG: hypothetical protein ACYDCS_09170 [Candidatus Dormibacteria bacterium]
MTLSACCTATLPTQWSTPQRAESGLDGSYDPTGRLYVTWQIVGSSHTCPKEPPGLVNSLVSPTHPSGDVIVGVDPLSVNGERVVAYITAPSSSTPRAYQYVNADATFGASCVDLGGAEYGAASTPHLETLLQILATTRSLSYAVKPTTS